MGGEDRHHDEQAAPQTDRPEPAAAGPETASPLRVVQALQRAAGNRAVAELLRQEREPRPRERVLARWFGIPWSVIPRFWWLTTGVAKENAPFEVELPEVMKRGMEKAWEKSLPETRSQEQGGILVEKADGTYAWKPGAAGRSGDFSINYGDVAAGETLVASAHTHPYSVGEGGHTDVAFSGGDLANFVTGSEKVKMVRSGSGEFVVAKSKEWNDLVAATPAAKIPELKTKIKTQWNDTFAAATGTFPERAEAAAKAVAKTCHLLFYKGSGGKLVMPEDMRPQREPVPVETR